MTGSEILDVDSPRTGTVWARSSRVQFLGTGTGLWERVFRRERRICGHRRL